MFLTQQGLTQELTLDLLEKYRNPEKLKTCLVTEDEEMEVGYDLKRYLALLYPFFQMIKSIVLTATLVLNLTELVVCFVSHERWRCLDL